MAQVLLRLSQLAVIDIGSNTINLLIAEHSENGFETIHFSRIPAKLAKGGMKLGILTSEAMQRGLDALIQHQNTCQEHGVSQVKVTATSAVRSASNGIEFVERVQKEVGYQVEIITGHREAELIWKGVRLTGLLKKGTSLIMDVGGGSTEFILADEYKVYWMKSYDLGVTRLKERFEAEDPFSIDEEKRMQSALSDDLMELWTVLEEHGVDRLIGASGSFNSISTMIAKGNLNKLAPIGEEIDLETYRELSEQLRRTRFEERRLIQGLLRDRVETMPYSVLLIDLVLSGAEIGKMMRSSYALKEGLMSEMR